MGIPSQIPFSNPGDSYLVGLEKTQPHRPCQTDEKLMKSYLTRVLVRYQEDPILSFLAACARTVWVKRTPKGESHKEVSTGFLVKSDNIKALVLASRYGEDMHFLYHKYCVDDIFTQVACLHNKQMLFSPNLAI